MDIKQALKERIKELKTELAASEKALAALVGDKPAPKAAASRGSQTQTAGSPAGSGNKPTSTSPTTPGNLPDRIVEYTTIHGLKSVDEIVQALAVPKGQVATTCSRMVRSGRLEKFDSQPDGVTRYMAIHEPKGAAPPKTEDPNPFASGSN